MDTDQMNYADMIAEARVLAEHLDEWNEQFQTETHESDCARRAADNVANAISDLSRARKFNEQRRVDRIELALKRVETGAATIHDAALLREALS